VEVKPTCIGLAFGSGGVGGGVLAPGLEPVLDPLVPEPLGDDPVEVEPDEAPEGPVVPLLDAGGGVSGAKGLRVDPWLWYCLPPGVSATAAWALTDATPMLSVLTAGGGETDGTREGLAPPEELALKAYAAAPTNATATQTSSGSIRLDIRSDLMDSSISVMGSPSPLPEPARGRRPVSLWVWSRDRRAASRLASPRLTRPNSPVARRRWR
jgi:hypothetical protein